jgi:hypothetical protein
MKKYFSLLLLLGCAASCSSAPAYAGGFFDEQDKQKHIILTGLLYGSSYAITLDYKKAMILTLGIGAMREAQKSMVNKGDIAADLIGAVGGYSIIQLSRRF